MPIPNKYNIHKFLFIASAGFFILFIVLQWLDDITLVNILVIDVMLPSALALFMLGWLTMRTRPLNPEGARRLASDNTNKLLQKLAHPEAESHLTNLSSKPPVMLRILWLTFSSDEELDSIIGDLIEEYAEVQSKQSNTRADMWLYKQVLKSALPLIYKNLKSRLATLFGVRAR